MAATIEILQDRSRILALARAFFSQRDIMETDCPNMTRAASIDAHIDLFPVMYSGKEKRYLHTSPEYAMKRLLSRGIGDIYHLGHVFRDGEHSAVHNPEFTVAEWYRVGMDFDDLIQETAEFLHLFFGVLPLERVTYREAFLQHAGIDPFTASDEQLLNTLRDRDLQPYIPPSSRDDILNVILGCLVEPFLGVEGLTALSYYPASQAALAQTTTRDGHAVAERFEMYYKGVELANGYYELTNPLEQRRRFDEQNAMRCARGLEELSFDEAFLDALSDLPDCCGVTVGIDRAFMLRHDSSNIADILPFSWDEA